MGLNCHVLQLPLFACQAQQAAMQAVGLASPWWLACSPKDSTPVRLWGKEAAPQAAADSDNGKLLVLVLVLVLVVLLLLMVEAAFGKSSPATRRPAATPRPCASLSWLTAIISGLA